MLLLLNLKVKSDFFDSRGAKDKERTAGCGTLASDDTFDMLQFGKKRQMSKFSVSMGVGKIT